MALLATGSRSQLLWIPESTFGVLPATPNMQFVRIPAAEKLKYEQTNLQSKEIRADRQIHDFLLGNAKAGGTFEQEVIYGHFDYWLQMALGGNWSLPLPPDVAPTLTDVVSGALAGATYYVKITYVNAGGESGPSAEATITVVTNHLFSVTSPPPRLGYTGYKVYASSTTGTETLQTTAAIAIGTNWQLPNTGLVVGAAVPAVASATLVNGTNAWSASMEVGHLDVSQYLQYSGMMVDQISLDVKINSIIKATMTMLGKGMAVPAAVTEATSTNAAVTYGAANAFTGVIKEGGTTFGNMTGIKLNLKNGLEAANVLGSKNLVGVFPGRLEVTGEISAWFADATLLTKWVNGTESSIEFSMWNPNSATKTLDFLLPRVLYTDGEAPTSTEKGITQTFKFHALLSDSAGYTLQVTRANS